MNRVKRNIFGDIIHSLTGLATDERLDQQAKGEEEVRGKITEVLKHQLQYEERMSTIVAELQSEGEGERRALEETRKKTEKGFRAVSRLFAYQAMLEEDEETLETVLEAMVEGKVGARLDAYLSNKCGLKTMAGFRYQHANRVPGGVVVHYNSRVYHSSRILEERMENGTWRVRTEEHHYILLPSWRGVPVIITEMEVCDKILFIVLVGLIYCCSCPTPRFGLGGALVKGRQRWCIFVTGGIVC